MPFWFVLVFVLCWGMVPQSIKSCITTMNHDRSTQHSIIRAGGRSVLDCITPTATTGQLLDSHLPRLIAA